jgi:hypothetical protein
MPDHYLEDPEHWRTRAEEARINAQAVRDPEAKRMLLDVAASYERLADRAGERARGARR